MCSNMRLEAIQLAVTFITILKSALVRFFIYMDFGVTSKMSFANKPFVTLWTSIGFVVCL